MTGNVTITIRFREEDGVLCCRFQNEGETIMALRDPEIQSDTRFVIDGLDLGGDAVHRSQLEGRLFHLAPGESRETELPVMAHCQFRKAGSYQVWLDYDARHRIFYWAEGAPRPDDVKTRSNIVSIDIPEEKANSSASIMHVLCSYAPVEDTEPPAVRHKWWQFWKK